MNLKWIFIVLLTAGLVLADAPTTGPVQVIPPAADVLAAKELIGGHSVEAFRLVGEKDEIVTTLRNGMTVICKRVPGKVLTVRCHVKAGSIHEGKWLGGGLSHLLEHLVAGGSNGRRTEEQNRNLLQALGNNSNAYTTFDTTSFFVNTTPDKLDEAVDLITGWVLTAKITPAEFEREREVVQRELEMGRGDPDTVFSELSFANRYRVSPARVPIIGYQEVIQTMTRDDVYAYYKLAYQPQNLVFAVAGDIDPARMLAAVQKYTADVPPGREFPRDIPAEPGITGPRTVVGTFPKLGHAKLELAFPTIKLDHPDLYALDLLAAVLSEGYGSELKARLRDEKHLVSEIWAYDDTPDYVEGAFVIGMTLTPDKIKQATDEVLALLDEVKRDGVDAEALKRAKTQMKVNRFRAMQTTDDISATMAADFIATGDPHFTERYVANLQKVTNGQIRAVARKYLNRDRLLTTALLSADDPLAASLPKAEDILRPTMPAIEAAATRPGDKTATRTVLPNGTVLLTKRIATTPMVAIEMYALGGVSVETEENNGLGYLAMNLIQRGTGGRNGPDIAEVFDSIGGGLSTDCGRNTWNWSAECLGEDFTTAFTTWAAMINHPNFDEHELPGIKQIILEEIESEEAQWEDQAFKFFRQKFYQARQSPYRFAAMGTRENLEKFTAQQARKFYFETILKAPRVIAVYGDIDPEQVKKLATELLGQGEKLPEIPKAAVVDDPPPPAAADTTPKINVTRVEVQKTDHALAGVVIGFESNSVVGSPSNAALTVADAMASGYDYPTGYIFETLRGLGLVYTAYAMDLPGRSRELPGFFVAAAGCDPKDVDQVVEQMLLNLARLQGRPADLNEDWFNRSKDMVVIADALVAETAEAQANQAAADEVLGLGYDHQAGFDARIRAVKLHEINDVARRRLTDCVITISTPNPELVKIKPGVKKYDSFPPVDLTPKGVKHDTK